MKEKDWSKVISGQICVHKGDKSLIEIINCMKPASRQFPWHMHAEGKEGENGRSLLRIVMLDYSNEQETVSVYANLKPEEIKYLYAKVFVGKEEVIFTQQKIFMDKESQDGRVTYLTITRHECDQNGDKRKYPWYIEIQNGIGEIAYNQKGGQYCKPRSYRKEKHAKIYLTDEDMFVFFCRANTVIEAYERDTLFHLRDVGNFQKLYKLLLQAMQGDKKAA